MLNSRRLFCINSSVKDRWADKNAKYTCFLVAKYVIRIEKSYKYQGEIYLLRISKSLVDFQPPGDPAKLSIFPQFLSVLLFNILYMCV